MRRVTAAPDFWDRRFADGRFNRVVTGFAPEKTSCGSPKGGANNLKDEVPEASGMSFLRSQGGVLRSPVPCWTRWALWGRSGGAPKASRGRSGGPRRGLGDLSGASGDGPGTPESDLFECRSDFGGALGGDGPNEQFLGGFGAFVASFFG